MKKMLISLITALFVISIAFTASAGQFDKITIATEGAFAPWNFTDSSGQLDGFEIELAEDLCKRMGVEYKMVPQAWDGIIPSLQAGKYDAIMAAMSITEKRKKAVLFSRYYAATPSIFIVLKNNGFDDLKTDVDAITLDEVNPEEEAAMSVLSDKFGGKTIGVQAATIQERFLQQYLGKSVEIKSYDTQENLELDLQSGRIDAALGAMSYWVPRLNDEKGKDFNMVGPGMTKGPFGEGVGVAVRQSDTELAEMFSKAINAAIADGTLSKLAIKWFTFDASAKE
jgi:octopine/nopaline transport system substrate-binding protein